MAACIVHVEQCESCGAFHGERHRPTMRRPDAETLAKWESEGSSEATDGCRVDPDGICPHGHYSWFLALGMI